MKTRVAPEPTTRDRSRAMGMILVEQGRLRPVDVDEIEQFAVNNGLRFGDAAQQLKLLTQQDIEFALAQQFNHPILERGGESGVSNELIAAYQPQDDAVEPLRVLRSQLILRWLGDVQGTRKVLAITSPGRREGRSWVAGNLATVFAQIGYRTLLIDTDMRHPNQHKVFNIDNRVGLSALLTGRAGREIVHRVHPQLRLFVVTAGIIPPNPQELLARPVFELILNGFAEQYDIVLLDTPAATESADAHILASNAGAAVVIAKMGQTPKTGLVNTVRDFVQSGVNVVGTIANR
jgi:protein-tyrosine kinase